MTKYHLFIGIDNGVSGTIGCLLYEEGMVNKSIIYARQYTVPTIKMRNYQQLEKNITRINARELHGIFNECVSLPLLHRGKDVPDTISFLLENPFVNPKMFNATLGSLRALEATLVVIEMMGFSYGIHYDYIPPKVWQKKFGIPVLETTERKAFAKKYAQSIYPDALMTGPDGDGLCIAHYSFLKFKGEV